MFTRTLLAAVLFGLALIGGATVPSARSDPPAPPPAKDGKPKTVEYFCPMHPHIVRDDPRYGKCPICLMPFSKQPARPDKRSPDERVQQWKADLAWNRAEIVPAIRANMSKLPPEDRLSAEAQGWCPILEANPLGLMGPPVKTTIKGRTVFLCCKDCGTDAKDNPEQTLAKADKLKALVKNQHDVKGKVVSVTVTIEHEDIPGVLKQGRMEFSVEGVKGLESLKAGELVQGKLKLKDGDYTITELSASQPAAPPPAKDGKPDAAARQVTLVGVVEFDERTLAHVAARLKGRIDKLHVAVVGQEVKRGDPLAEMYSPDLLTTTQELLDANRIRNRNLEGIARRRLRLWGVGDDQIEQVLKTGKAAGTVTVRSPIAGHVVKKYQAEGDTVEEGARLFDVADLSTVWVEAPVPDQSDLAVIKEGLPVRVTARAIPDRRFDGAVLVAAYRDPDSKTLRVRFAVNNPRLELRPGMHVTAVVGAAPAAETAELRKAKVATAKVAYEATFKAFAEGKADAEKVYLWSRRWMEAERDASDKQPDRIVAVAAHLERMKKLRTAAEARYRTGQAPHPEVLGTDFSIAEAELWLAQAKAE